jgi:integrase
MKNTVKKERTTKPLDWKEAKKCLAYLESEKKYNLLLTFAVGIHTGFRVSDLLELKYGDFSNDKEVLNIQERKTSKQRAVKIFSELRMIVQVCKDALKKSDNDYLFTRSRYRVNKPISKVSFIQRVKDALDFCGIKYETAAAHTLRKTFALHYYKMFEKRVGSHRALIETAKQLNHASTDVTRRYIGIDETTKTEVLENWDIEF